MDKEFLDYAGLQVYDEEIKAWVQKNGSSAPSIDLSEITTSLENIESELNTAYEDRLGIFQQLSTIEGKIDSGFKNLDEALEKIIEIQEGIIGGSGGEGHSIKLILIENGRSLNGSFTLPTDNFDTDFTDSDYDEEPLSFDNVKELYVWANEDVAYISISWQADTDSNSEIIYYTNDGTFEYAKANPIQIPANGIYTITTDW